MEEFDELVAIMARLRAPGGCPWDREQDHRSLRHYFVEEVYEALEALDDEDMHRFCGELGDVMLQIVFHARLAEEAGEFNVREVLRRINEKLIRRHPHVFGDVAVSGADDVLDNWQEIKLAEGENVHRESAVDGVPRGLPSLQRAYDLQRRAARVGFDWPDIGGVWAKVAEETGEVREAAAGGEPAEVEAEVGDLLFAVVNLARFLGVEPEQALRAASLRFEARFRQVEKSAEESGRNLREMGLGEMDELWEAAKRRNGEAKA
jgi:MazG family protein